MTYLGRSVFADGGTELDIIWAMPCGGTNYRRAVLEWVSIELHAIEESGEMKNSAGNRKSTKTACRYG